MFPKQILVEHLERTYGDLHDISLNLTNVLKAKNDLEDKLLKTESYLSLRKSVIQNTRRDSAKYFRKTKIVK